MGMVQGCSGFESLLYFSNVGNKLFKNVKFTFQAFNREYHGQKSEQKDLHFSNSDSHWSHPGT